MSVPSTLGYAANFMDALKQLEIKEDQEVKKFEQKLRNKLHSEIDIKCVDEIKKSLQSVIKSSEIDSTDPLIINSKKILEKMNNGSAIRDCFNEDLLADPELLVAILRDQTSFLINDLVESKMQNNKLNQKIELLQAQLNYANAQINDLSIQKKIYESPQNQSKVALDFVTKFIGSQFESFAKTLT